MGTEEDMTRLLDVIEYHDHDYKQIYIDSPLLCSVLNEKLEDMPLHINDSIAIDQILAKWRLQYGK